MSELNRALSDIDNIRSQLAAGTMFQGFGPVVIGTTGGLAIIVASLQSLWPSLLAVNVVVFLFCWVATAVVCAVLIGIEMVLRTYRKHAGLADAMLLKAVECFLPAGLAGAAVSAVFYLYAPSALWILPGLWQVLVALGLYSAIRILPSTINLVAAWYLLAGVAVLIFSANHYAAAEVVPSPWLMGLPFAIGQLGMAVILTKAEVGGGDGDF